MVFVSASSPSSTPPRHDRWWIIAGIAALVAMALAALVWFASTWPGTWIIATGLLVFAIIAVVLFQGWYRRVASICLGLSAISAGLPSFAGNFELTSSLATGSGSVLVDNAPVASLGFLILTAFFGLLDYNSRYGARSGSNSKNPFRSRVVPYFLLAFQLPVIFVAWLANKGQDTGDRPSNITIASPLGSSSPGIVKGNVTYNQGVLDPETIRKIINRYDSDLDLRDKQIEELKAALSRVETAAEGGDPQARAAIKEARESGNVEELQASLVQLANQLGDNVKLMTDEYVELCREIASVAYLRGDIDEARSRLQMIIEADPNDWGAINNLGNIHLLRGELDAAVLAYQRVLDLSKDNPAGQAAAYGNLGRVLATRGDLDGAEAMYRKAMEIAMHAREMQGMHATSVNLAAVFVRRGNLDAAEAIYRKLLEMDKRSKNYEGMARVYNNLGVVLKMRDDLEGAEAMHREALEINERLGRIEGMATQYTNLGIMRLERGDVDGAEVFLRKALELHEKLGRLEGVAITYLNLGLVFKSRGDIDGAEAIIRKSIEISETLGDLHTMATAYVYLGKVQGMRGDAEDVRASWIKARDLFQQIGIPVEVEKVQSLLDVLPDSDA